MNILYIHQWPYHWNVMSQKSSLSSPRASHPRFLDLISRHPIGGNAKAFQLRGKFLLPAAQWLMGHARVPRCPKGTQGSQFSGKCWINLDGLWWFYTMQLLKNAERILEGHSHDQFCGSIWHHHLAPRVWTIPIKNNRTLRMKYKRLQI